MERWRFMLWGGVGVGKTTLLRALRGHANLKVLKTQMVEYEGSAIDTPGEYSEMSRLTRHLLSTAADAQVLVVVQDATRATTNFSPNYFLMFTRPTIGVVTKIDAPGADPERAKALLRRIGVTGNIFCVSAIDGTGLNELRQALDERSKQWQTIMEKHSA